jgi:uncharacterized protein (TIGR03437 family)
VEVVSNCGQPSERRSLPIPLTILPAAPELFFVTLSESGRNPIQAIVNDTPQRLGAPELGPGFRRARAGDVITIFLTGLGLTNPQFASGELPEAAGAAVNPVTLELAGRVYQPVYAGVTPGNAGLYQVSFVPDSATPSGDLDVKITVQTPGGPISTPPGAFLAFE